MIDYNQLRSELEASRQSRLGRLKRTFDYDVGNIGAQGVNYDTSGRDPFAPTRALQATGSSLISRAQRYNYDRANLEADIGDEFGRLQRADERAKTAAPAPQSNVRPGTLNTGAPPPVQPRGGLTGGGGYGDHFAMFEQQQARDASRRAQEDAAALAAKRRRQRQFIASQSASGAYIDQQTGQPVSWYKQFDFNPLALDYV